MKPTLQFKLSPHLTLTPQLQQSIRLLQLSTVELNQEIERITQENPLLELDDIAGTDYRGVQGDGQPEPLAHDATDIIDSPVANALGQDIELDARKSSVDDHEWREDGGLRAGRDDDEDRDFPQQAAEPLSLRDHLYSQLS